MQAADREELSERIFQQRSALPGWPTGHDVKPGVISLQNKPPALAGKGQAPAPVTQGPARRAGGAAYTAPSKTPENRIRRSRFRILPLAFLGSSETIAKCLGLL